MSLVRSTTYETNIEKVVQVTSYIEISNGKVYLVFKRIIDIFGAGIGLILLSPLCLTVALLIKVEDPRGKVFFKQRRVGINGNTFYMYKFRSMISNAEELLDSLLDQNEIKGAMFKIKKDPRVTRIGRFIRKTSIDELPQLWNVLKNEMSLVGPRPPLPREVNYYSDRDMNRLLVKPGCTGLWQISGRNNLSFNDMVELDLLYLKNRSILFDVKIVLKTVLVLFGTSNAY